MNKNYYEWLEINKNASPEIIEKAYKTLVKKYHPDLQQGNKKIEFEEKLKIINEAYDVLSTAEKRKEYDLSLKEHHINPEDYKNLYQENQTLKSKLNDLEQYHFNSSFSQDNSNPNNQVDPNVTLENLEDLERNYQQQYQEKVNQAYHDAYVQDLKNRGYKIRYKKTWKDYFKTLIALLRCCFIFNHTLANSFYSKLFYLFI